MGWIELTTESGVVFRSRAMVHIGDHYYDMDELTDAQRMFVATKLNEQALNAVYAGRAVFEAEGMPRFEEVFSD